MFLPLFGVDLKTDIQFNEPPPSEIAALLSKQEHDGLEIEMRLLDKPDIIPKTIFMVPGGLSVQERDAVRRKLSDHGLTLDDDASIMMGLRPMNFLL